MQDVTTLNTPLESTMDEGTPGEPHHWRVLYIRWSDGAEPADGQPQGVAIEDVLDVLLDRISEVHGLAGKHEDVSILRQMLSADKYGGPEAEQPDQNPAIEGDGPLYQQEYLTGDELAAQGVDTPFAAQAVDPHFATQWTEPTSD